MVFYANDVHPIPPDHGADDCDDQLPLISRVGRGLKGNSSLVRISDPDTESETHLEGLTYDEASKTYKTEWISENINGGQLLYQYNLRPYTIPRTFTITFMYRRPGRKEWSWTTPAIPYIWTIDNDGNKQEDPDAIVGSGVATLFVRASKSEAWNIANHERLIYPEGTTRNDYNAPKPNEAWTAMLTFGKGGDIELPNFDELAKILGISKGDIFNILEGNKITINGVEASNLRDYIDKQDDNHLKSSLDHIHADLGFNSTGHGSTGAFGGKDTVKQYIDQKAKDAHVEIASTNEFLTVTTGTPSTGYGTKYNLTPLKIVGGPGIAIDKSKPGKVIISNTMLAGDGVKLTEGTDFDLVWHNGWYCRKALVNGEWVGQGQPLPIVGPNENNIAPIEIYALISQDDSEIYSAILTIKSPIYPLMTYKDLKNQEQFLLCHSSDPLTAPKSAMFSFSFKGAYAALNDMSFPQTAAQATGIWNVRGLNVSLGSASYNDFVDIGASWNVSCSLWKRDELDDPDNIASQTYKKFIVTATSIADGHNDQFSVYNSTHVVISSWANFTLQKTLIP